MEKKKIHLIFDFGTAHAPVRRISPLGGSSSSGAGSIFGSAPGGAVSAASSSFIFAKLTSVQELVLAVAACLVHRTAQDWCERLHSGGCVLPSIPVLCFVLPCDNQTINLSSHMEEPALVEAFLVQPLAEAEQ